jgi:hypothetical protein
MTWIPRLHSSSEIPYHCIESLSRVFHSSMKPFLSLDTADTVQHDITSHTDAVQLFRRKEPPRQHYNSTESNTVVHTTIQANQDHNQRT